MSTLEQLYLKMLRIRLTEEEIIKEYPKEKMRLPVHLSIGQEACAVAICEFLDETDQMVSSHRNHSHYLAMGGDLTKFVAELYGKKTGCAGGYGGSMHSVDQSCGFMASTSIVAQTVPIGVGLAFAKKLKKEKGIVVICIGDAAIEEGVFHESANFCALHGLPVLFVLENNLYSCYTHIKDRQPDRPLKKVAYAHNFIHRKFFGQDVAEIVNNIGWIFGSVRSGKPALIEFETYRYLQHCGVEEDDHLNYRKPEEVAFWKLRDPLAITRGHLDALNLWKMDKAIETEAVKNEVKDAFRAAKAAEFPVWKES